MNPLRWLGRAFFARIGWVLAGLVLLFFGLDARAALPTCGAGYTPLIKVSRVTPYNPACSVGDQFGSAAEYLSGCGIAHGVTWSGSWHWAGGASSSEGSDIFETIPDPTEFGTERALYVLEDVHQSNHSLGSANQESAGAEYACVPTPECEIEEGTRVGWAATGAPAEACFDNCIVQLHEGIDFGIGTGPANYYRSTGTMCDDEDPAEIDTPDHKCEGEVCAHAGNAEITDNTDPLQDGTTPDQVIAEGCVTTESGAMFCIPGDEGTPDNGTPGTTATPDQVIDVPPPLNGSSSGPSTTVNYYNSSTVSNSTNAGTGDPDGEGEDSSGECEEGDTECEGGGRGDGRVRGPGGTAQSFASATEAFLDGVAGSDIGEFASGVGGMIPDGGICPTASFSVFDTTFTIDAQCAILDEYYDQFRAIFAFLWLLLAAIIMLRP